MGVVSDNRGLAVAGALAGGALALAAGYAYYRSVSLRRKPAGNVSDIILYPIKSGPALHVKSAQCTETGLRYKAVCDRQFVLVNETENAYIPIRKNLKLLDLQLTYDEPGNCLILKAAGMENLSIPLQIPEYDQSRIKSFMWYDNRETFYFDMGDVIAKWFSTALNQECRLGFSHPDIDRQINPKFIYNHASLHSQTKIQFANSHPYLITNQSSLDDLNLRLPECVTMEGFRPNIIVAAGANSKPSPYEEDSWRELAIGSDAVLYNTRPCPRCPMIYVDYQKHESRANKEPMTTLLKYRRGTQKQDSSKAVFGINVALIKCGEISLGDGLQVTTQ